MTYTVKVEVDGVIVRQFSADELLWHWMLTTGNAVELVPPTQFSPERAWELWAKAGNELCQARPAMSGDAVWFLGCGAALVLMQSGAMHNDPLPTWPTVEQAELVTRLHQVSEELRR